VRPSKKRKKISTKLREIIVVVKRDKYVIIIALILAIAIHMYVRYEKAQNKAPIAHELTPRD
jgi:hypothetical protein